MRPADKLQLKAAIILPLVGLARSKQDPINGGHGAQYLYCPLPAGAKLSAMQLRICVTGAVRCAAAQKPVILLPGVNHACLSNGHMRPEANDLAAEVSAEDANLQVAGIIADFIMVHTSTNE